VRQLVDEVWAEELEQARRAGRDLFNGELVRYLGHRIAAGRLEIEVGATDYAHFLATNIRNAGRAMEIGWDQFSCPMGTSTTLLTTDGWLLAGRRNDRVAIHRNTVHAFSGSFEANRKKSDGTFDVFANMRRELKEELGIDRDDIVEMTCLGLACDREVRQPELLFDTQVRLTRDEIASQIDPNSPDEEHAEIVGCRCEADAIVPFLESCGKIAPLTVGSYCLVAQRRSNCFNPFLDEDGLGEIEGV
jgi:8-oxo-dGTP pyrophosphatase MutT (NUDIX family)